MSTVNLNNSVIRCDSCRNHVDLLAFSGKTEKQKKVINAFHNQMIEFNNEKTLKLCRDKFRDKEFKAILSVFGKNIPDSVDKEKEPVISIKNPHFDSMCDSKISEIKALLAKLALNGNDVRKTTACYDRGEIDRAALDARMTEFLAVNRQIARAVEDINKEIEQLRAKA